MVVDDSREGWRGNREDLCVCVCVWGGGSFLMVSKN